MDAIALFLLGHLGHSLYKVVEDTEFESVSVYAGESDDVISPALFLPLMTVLVLLLASSCPCS